jgi:Zn-dependent peptidase ImmA (M78 family)
MRAELGIKNIERLDPFALAALLGIPVMSLTQLDALDLSIPDMHEAVEFLTTGKQSALSAMTVFAGTRRLIVYNDANPSPRQASDLSHELGHGLLLHQPVPALDERGCRAWDPDIENEASYLGGALLIPGKAARYIAKSGMTTDDAAARFVCSIEMVNWRLNETGARRMMKTT